jgi:hypothetical protein
LGATAGSARSWPAQKAAAAAGQDDAAHRGVGRGGGERGGELAVHRPGEAVERLRAVQRQRPDAGLVAHQDERFFHGCVSFGDRGERRLAGRRAKTKSTDR